MAVVVEQAAECVLHRAGDGGEDVCLHCGQVKDVLADEGFGNLEAVRVDAVEGEHLVLRLEVDPLLVFEVEGFQVRASALQVVCLLLTAPSFASTTTVPLWAGMRSS